MLRPCPAVLSLGRTGGLTMMIRAWILTIWACALIILPCEINAQEGGAGIVEEIRGTALWRRNANAKPKRLDPKLDTARLLYPGEQVRCLRGSSLRLSLGQKPRIVPPTAWYTIPRVAFSRLAPIKRMLDDYGRRSGRDRAGEIIVFSPSDHSVVLMKPFIIRWVPSAAGCSFTLLIQDAGANKVWRKDDVEGASGSLNDALAERALIEYRAKGGRGPLTLIVNDSCGSMTRLNFSLLTTENEKSLKEDLFFWDKQTGTFVPHLGRASVYNRYGMFSQAAEEYDAALKEAPYSLHLLLRTVSAHRVTGNFTRVGELKNQLPEGTRIP